MQFRSRHPWALARTGKSYAALTDGHFPDVGDIRGSQCELSTEYGPRCTCTCTSENNSNLHLPLSLPKCHLSDIDQIALASRFEAVNETTPAKSLTRSFPLSTIEHLESPTASTTTPYSEYFPTSNKSSRNHESWLPKRTKLPSTPNLATPNRSTGPNSPSTSQTSRASLSPRCVSAHLALDGYVSHERQSQTRELLEKYSHIPPEEQSKHVHHIVSLNAVASPPVQRHPTPSIPPSHLEP